VSLVPTAASNFDWSKHGVGIWKPILYIISNAKVKRILLRKSGILNMLNTAPSIFIFAANLSLL